MIALNTVSTLLCALGVLANPIVFTERGPVRGKSKIVGTHQINQFLKIPYAQPPVGNLRFKKPSPIANWTGTLNATVYGPSCAQKIRPFLFLKNQDISEDCLHLNIFVPVSSFKKPKPVMVWIHGGSYIYGQGSLYDSSLVAVNGDVIVVTINYRLGILGFLSVEEFHGNYGIWDQIEALKWVKQNIAYFGGDVNHITLFGESAGGSSIGILATTPQHTSGLFHRVIMQSGGYNNIFTLSNVKKDQWNTFLKIIGCFSTTSSNITMSCLREKNIQDIVSAEEKWLDLSGYEEAKSSEDFNNVVYLGPVLDNELLCVNPKDALNDESSAAYKYFRSLDVMGGVTSGEGSVMKHQFPSYQNILQTKINMRIGIPRTVLQKIAIPYKMTLLQTNKSSVANLINEKYGSDDLAEQARKLAEFIADIVFNVPLEESLHLHAHGNKVTRTFQYLFDEISMLSLLSDRPPWFVGAAHGDDLAYIFGAYRLLPLLFADKAQKELGDRMIEYWTNFAKTGDPNNGTRVITKWPQYSTDQKHYLHFKAVTIRSGVNLFHDRVRFWLSTISEQLSQSPSAAVLSSPRAALSIFLAVTVTLWVQIPD